MTYAPKVPVTAGADGGVMRDRIRHALNAAKATAAGEAEPRCERRETPIRAPRRRLMALVRCQSGDAEVEGYTLNISYTGLLVQCGDHLPQVGEKCEVKVLLPQGELRGRGQVTRVDEKERRAAVRLTHLAKNGYLLLAGYLAEFGTGGRIVLARRL